MNVFECTLNMTFCMQLYELGMCPSVENHCLKMYGNCFINKADETKCVCSPCFTGDHCEEEASRNLWEFGLLFNAEVDGLISTNGVIQPTFGILNLFNGLLCLQTYLCRKIRQTNLGIYLIMLSIISTYMGLSHFIPITIGFFFKELRASLLYTGITCLYQKYAYTSFFPMFNWFIAAVAIERVLVEYFIGYGLHDSRLRSIIFSVIIIIFCFLSTLPGMFTVRDNPLSALKLIYCQNFTPVGYIIYKIIESIHLFAFYFVYSVMNIVVLIKFVRQRQRFVDNNSLSYQIGLVLGKHKDFFIPYLIQAICVLPSVLMDFIMTCPTAGKMSMIYMHVMITVLKFLPVALIFYLHVCLSPVYLSIFWESSPVGRCLMYIKHKWKLIYQSRISDNSIPLQTLS